MLRPSRTARLITASAIAAFTVTGCSADSDSTSQSSTSVPSATSSSTATPDSSAQTPAGTGPLAFTATTLTGQTVDVSTLSAGKPTVLWFWAPWCTICRGEAPTVAAAAKDLTGKVTFIGVPGMGEKPAMEDFVKTTSTNGFSHLVDEDGALWRRFEVTSQPSFVFISADGKIEKVVGALGDDALRSRAAQLVN
ncbi:MAG: TlpA family protein disulfide reductase [Actinomycetota bacterium]